MASQTGWIFIAVVLLLMALFAVSVFVTARKQKDPAFFLDEEE
ncbi:MULTISPECIES: hypothetical protein [unclassified Sporosarcina]|nr:MULTISPECIES: hypothetical protein [unclassified Sporosarcina]GKV65817.1 hypothetical protein NCCP2331_19700 [Sporosarcina sp. NCCP-2331]GLB55941.1 hypothetical protein NCCP2378_17280 [Sporosarcina sp. NCCP-2378]